MNHSYLMIALLCALGGTVGALGFGLFALFKGGEFNAKYGNRSMRWRILFQSVALMLFMLMLIFGK